MDIVNIDRKADDLGTNTSTVAEKADNSGICINIVDIDKRANNLGRKISIVDVDREADNLSISTSAADGKTNNLGTGIADTNADKKADRQAIANNKTYTSISFLYKAIFIFILFSELEVVSAFLFVFLLFLMTLLKRKALFSIYFMAKMGIPNLNKALSVITFVLT